MNAKENITSKLRDSNNIVLMGHTKGDSDSFGSMIGLKFALEKLDKTVTILAESDFPGYLNFLNDYVDVRLEQDLPKPFDLLVVLDCAEASITSFPEYINLAKNNHINVLQVDHHTKGGLAKIADISWADTNYCAVCEMVYELVIGLNIEIDKKIATSLLAGIEGDTSGFQNQNTSENCMLVASELITNGGRLNKIVRGASSSRDVDTLKLWGLVLDRLKINEDGIAISYLSYKDAEKLGISKTDFGPVTNFLNSVKGVKILMFVTDDKEGYIKVSLRTRDDKVNVAKIAKSFGGGGHVKAAAFRFPGSFELENNLVKIV